MLNFKALEDFEIKSQNLAKELLYLIDRYNRTRGLFITKELLENLNSIKAEVGKMKTNPAYNFSNKRVKKEFEFAIKQLEAGCDKVEKAIKNGNLLFFF
jgi:energy-coupling factor transporter ATP-binding protein EcfA2